MKITKIEVQKNNKNRVNLFVDDNFFCGLSVETIMKNRIKENSEVSLPQLEFLKNETEKEIAFSRAVNYLSKTAKTKKQIKDYLLKKGFDENIISYVLEKLCEYNFVNDEIYAKNYVKCKTRQNGKRKILMELKRNGINETLANEKIEELSCDHENIKNVAEKYLRNKVLDIKTKQKVYRFLMLKGYESDDIISCLNLFFMGEEN